MTNAAREIAQKFVAARRQAKALSGFPGEQPTDLATAYRVQEQALALWGDDIAGWKIGRIPPHFQEVLKADRLEGPIFNHLVWSARAKDEVAFPIYENGFAAVEAEYVFRIGTDAPADKTDFTREEAAALVSALHIGVECAGSPLRTINELGPTVVVSDFGNNHGLILGPEIPNWRALKDEDLRCEMFIDDKSVGTGGAASIPDGPLGALIYLLGHLARRGRPLKAGQLVSTGAATGIHDIRIGQKARAHFDFFGEIRCAAVKAAALDTLRAAEPR